jgi:hypothetical protein
VSRHAAGRRPRSLWLEAWQLAHRASLAWRGAGRWRRARRRRILIAVAYYLVAVLAVDTLAMLISGGR